MKDTINTYFAVLIVVIAGAGAAWFIIRLATSDAPLIKKDSQASYSALKESILKPN